MSDDRVNNFTVVLLVVFISAVFLSMVRSFLMTIFLAGIFSALAHPIYQQLVKMLNGRRSLASVLTLLLLLIVVVLLLAPAFEVGYIHHISWLLVIPLITLIVFGLARRLKT